MFRKTTSTVKVGILLVAAALAVLPLMGCGGGSGDGGGGGASTGTLKLAIADKMSNDFQSVVISIKEVRVVPAGREDAADSDPALPLVVRYDTPKVIDIMQLQFVQQVLGEVVLPAGTYSQVRLILEPNPDGNGQELKNYLVLQSDLSTKIPLTTPSGQQSGLKILGPLEVQPGGINAFMIDFDPNTAIVARGNGEYNLKPTSLRLVAMPDMLTK